MAIYNPTTADAITAKQWVERKTLAEAIRETYLYRFMGSDDSSIIHVKDDLSRKKGDAVNFQLRARLTGRGRTEGETLKGNEEALTYYNDSVSINELRHAVNVPFEGNIHAQRTFVQQYEDASPALRDWYAERLDTWFFNQICGYAPQTDTIYTGNNAITVVDSGHLVYPAAITADENLTSSNTFTITLIDKMVTKARNATFPIRPVRVNGEEKYVLFIHDYQEYSLRTEADASGAITWFRINEAAMQGGNTARNPIYTGAIGEYNGVVIHRTPRVTLGVTSTASTTSVANVRRAALCGAQAAGIAFGQGYSSGSFSMKEETEDYEHEIGVGGCLIAGLKRTIFNSATYGAIICPTYAAAP